MSLLLLTYRNLFFRYLGRRLVLKGVSGLLSRGSCVAVVGAPDSGATTLLRCLAGRQPKGKLEGSLLIDGRPPDKTRKILLFFLFLFSHYFFKFIFKHTSSSLFLFLFFLSQSEELLRTFQRRTFSMAHSPCVKRYNFLHAVDFLPP